MKTLILLLSVLFTTMSFAQVPNYVPANGLVGYWPFNGNANDESGNGNNGANNGATLTIDRNGVANQAYSFDGDDRIDVGNLNLGQIQYSYTYSTWFRTSSTSNTDKTIISDYNSSSGDDDIFSCWNLLEFNNQVVRFETRNYPNGYGVGSTSPLNNGVWHNMVSVLDRNTGQLELYVDGIFISSTSFPNLTNFDANGFLRFGVHMWSNTFQSSAYWIGEIDDIGIWNRALTQQEITNLYTSTVPVSCLPAYVPTSGLVGYWPFCGNANDESGNGNNGTVNGATLTIDRNGIANSAYSFDGVDDYIIGLSNSFPTNQRTVSVWFFSNNIGIGNLGRGVLGYGGNTCGQSWNMHLDNPGSPLGLDSYEVNTHCNVFSVTSSYGSLIPNGNWHNWVVTTDPSGTYFYLDGVIINSSNSFINNTVAINKNFVFGIFPNENGIGASINEPNNTVWNGMIDDIGIWNRALTDCEIQNLYTSTNPSNTTTATACDSYTWNGTNYSESGVYTGTTTNCVTESLNLTITPSSTNTTSQTACNSYTWNGQTYTQSGVYTGTTANCVTESLNLTITPAPIVNQIPNQTICSGMSAFIFFSSSTPGTNFSWSCNTNMNISGYNCNGNGNVLSEVLYNNTSVPQVLVYTIVGTNNYGCISQPINFFITVLPSSTNTTTAAACDSYTWNGQTYSSSGVYTGATANCVTESLNLTITPSSTNTTSASACGSYVWNGTTYTSSGVYTGTTTNCVTQALNLTITPSSTNTTTATACDSYTWNGQTYSSSGVYTGATANCVTESLNLTITPSSTNTTSQTACDFYTWNGQTYTSSGVYTGTTSNCVTQALNLTINTNTSSSISQTALDSYTWPVNSQTYTTTGAYTAVIPNAAGCDSTITLNLTMSFTGINDLSTSKLSIYPNPTNGDFTITGLELVGTVSSLSLTDMNGKVVKVLDPKVSKFSMASIKPGVYFLNILSGNKQEVLKIVKE